MILGWFKSTFFWFWELGRPPPHVGKNSQKIPQFFFECVPNGDRWGIRVSPNITSIGKVRVRVSTNIIAIGKMFPRHHHPKSQNDLKRQNLWQYFERKLLVPLNSQLSGSTFNSPRQKIRRKCIWKAPIWMIFWRFSERPLTPPCPPLLRKICCELFQNFCEEHKKIATT